MTSKFNSDSTIPAGFTPEQLVECKNAFVASLKERDTYSINQVLKDFPALATTPIPREAFPVGAQTALAGYENPSLVAGLIAMKQGAYAINLLADTNPDLLSTLMHREYKVGQQPIGNLNNEGFPEEQPDLLHLAIEVQDINSASALYQSAVFTPTDPKGTPYGYLAHALEKTGDCLRAAAENPSQINNAASFAKIDTAVDMVHGLTYAGAKYDPWVPAEAKDAYEHRSAYDLLSKSVDTIKSCLTARNISSSVNTALVDYIVKESTNLINFMVSTGVPLDKGRADYLATQTGTAAYLTYKSSGMNNSEQANEALKTFTNFMVGVVATVTEISGSTMPRAITNLSSHAKSTFANDETKEMFNDVLRKMEFVVANNKAKTAVSNNVEAKQQEVKAAAAAAGVEVDTSSTRSTTRQNTMRI